MNKTEMELLDDAFSSYVKHQIDRWFINKLIPGAFDKGDPKKDKEED